ncbi:hypothetical protein SSS_02783 [Sarcoptes scabiei]|uniref:Uncharacterized protein n=1 Tax=Sarcoptes scabiei TaxID=52283 RepID=A0A834RGB9_SARSC|nr:hypothetical protein SSS_02783 [Sarcoptes scabiei]
MSIREIVATAMRTFMFDKEYSTVKSSGRKNGHHSYYGDHDHGSKAGIDAHKNYDLKKYGHKNYNNYDGYDDGPMMNVHEYVPVIESYGGVLNPLPKTDSIGSNYNSYGVNSNPFYTNHQSSPIMNSAYSIYPSGEEGVYLSSASDAQKSNIAIFRD